MRMYREIGIPITLAGLLIGTLAGCTAKAPGTTTVVPTFVIPTPVAAGPQAGATGTVLGASTTVTTTLGNGWIGYWNQQEAFALALPAGWKHQDHDPNSREALLATARGEDPNLAALLTQFTATPLEAGMPFRAFELNSDALATGYPINVTVLKRPTDRGTTLDHHIPDLVSYMRAQAYIVQPIRQTRLSLNGLPAEKLEFGQKRTSAGGDVPNLAITQYVVIRGADIFYLTFAVPEDQATRYAPTFETIAQSFRVLDEGD